MDDAFLADVLVLMQLYLDHKKRKKRRGVHRILKMRKKRGQFATLFEELAQDPAYFKEYTRMTLHSFNKLLEMIKPRYFLSSLTQITPNARLKRSSIREPISPEQRLIVALRFLATGASFRQLHFDFFLAEVTVRRICHTTCRAIVDILQPVYVRTPSSEEECAAVAAQFWERWQLPNCVGKQQLLNCHTFSF